MQYLIKILYELQYILSFPFQLSTTIIIAVDSPPSLHIATTYFTTFITTNYSLVVLEKNEGKVEGNRTISLFIEMVCPFSN